MTQARSDSESVRDLELDAGESFDDASAVQDEDDDPESLEGDEVDDEEGAV
jgi:hypothetical protein